MLITWHHLSDRIESTFLHMLRWCSTDGFVSMIKEEKNSHLFEGTILRPLLSLSKRYILSLCNKYHIPYVIDTSNQDTTMSKRNKLRHDIIEPLLSLANKNTTQENTFEKSIKQIYGEIEQVTKWQHENITTTDVSPSKNKTSIQTSNRAKRYHKHQSKIYM